MHRRLLLIHIFALLISCNSGTQKSDLKVFRFNASNNINSLDPAFASTQDNIWGVSQIFNGLIELDEHLIPKPGIAKHWEIDNYGKRYTFHLRGDVSFHNHPAFTNSEGRKVKASDFVYSLHRILDPKTASPGAWIFNDRLDSIPFEAPNDSTLVINLRQAFSPFLSLLSMPYCFVVPREVIEQTGKKFGHAPIGTGPFLFKQWEDDVKLILRKNPHYFETGLPHIDAVSISFIKNKQTAFLEFVQGKLDFFNGIESSFKDQIIDREGQLAPALRDQADLLKGPFLNTEYLAIYLNPDNPKPVDSFFLNYWFRKALNHAIDRSKMILFLRNGVGEAADGGFIPKGMPAYHALADSVYSYSLDAARDALKRSNYDGQTSITLSTTKDYLDLCIFVQSQWREIGIRANIDVMPSSILKNEKRHGGLRFFRASWIADYADGENFLSCFYSKNKAPNGPNYTHFDVPEFDRLYERSLQIDQDHLKMKAYREMDSLLMSHYPIVPLFYDESVWLKSKKVENLILNPLKIPRLKLVNISE